ncbi:MAG: hypothetical protein ACJ761_03595 [Chloroflexota bacterium]
MGELIDRVMRELPDTDRDRYDVAYERGRAQARSIMLFGGMAIGAAVAAVTTYLLDPDRGAGRRAKLAEMLAQVRANRPVPRERAIVPVDVMAPLAGATDATGGTADATEATRTAERETVSIG